MTYIMSKTQYLSIKGTGKDALTDEQGIAYLNDNLGLRVQIDNIKVQQV